MSTNTTEMTETTEAESDTMSDLERDLDPVVASETLAEDGFDEEFALTIGRVAVEDKHGGETLTQWKAITDDGHSAVSTSIMDAVMGAVEEQTGGVL